MIWKQIENFNYEINELGQVRNTKFNNRLLKAYNNGNGYINVDLFKNGKSHPIGVHVLLMTYFGEGERKAHVNHKDGNRSNNSLENLEWTTSSENHKHRFHVLKRTAVRDNKTGRWIKEFPNDC